MNTENKNPQTEPPKFMIGFVLAIPAMPPEKTFWPPENGVGVRRR
jgi:hypothetical protein